MTEDEKREKRLNILINGTPKTAKKLQLKCIKLTMKFLINTLQRMGCQKMDIL